MCAQFDRCAKLPAKLHLHHNSVSARVARAE
jgi:hypothetical protein